MPRAGSGSVDLLASGVRTTTFSPVPGAACLAGTYDSAVQRPDFHLSPPGQLEWQAPHECAIAGVVPSRLRARIRLVAPSRIGYSFPPCLAQSRLGRQAVPLCPAQVGRNQLDSHRANVSHTPRISTDIGAHAAYPSPASAALRRPVAGGGWRCYRHCQRPRPSSGGAPFPRTVPEIFVMIRTRFAFPTTRHVIPP